MPRSWWSVVPRFSILVIYLVAAIGYWWWFPRSFLYTSNFAVMTLYILAFMISLFAIRPVLSMFNTYQEITTDGIFAIEGIYSLNTKKYMIPFRDIAGVLIHRTIYDRICGMGDIEIGTAMTGRTELRLRGICNPDYYSAMIQLALDKREEFREEIELANS